MNGAGRSGGGRRLGRVRVAIAAVVGVSWFAAGLPGQTGGVREDSKTPPAFRLRFRSVGTDAHPGMTEMSRSPLPPVYVGAEELLRPGEILAVVGSSSTGVDLKVSDDVVAHLRADGVARVAILDRERLASVAELVFADPESPWNLRLTGLGRAEAARLSWMLSEEANSRLTVSMVVTPPSDAQPAGGLMDVVVYLVGAKSISAYQFVLEVSTPARGWMRREGLLVDTARDDYVFRGVASQPSVDDTTGIVGASVAPRAVETDGKAVYLGSVRFRTPPDAVGHFKVHVKRCAETFVKDENGAPLLFNHGGAVLRVHERVPPRVEKATP